MSREHAALTVRDGSWYVEDRGSFNGTFLNGTRVQPGVPLPLRHADRIGIGSETFLFSWPAQLRDPDTTEPLDEVAAANGRRNCLSFQRQVVQLSLRAVAGRCESRELAVERADRGRSSARPARPAP